MEFIDLETAMLWFYGVCGMMAVMMVLVLADHAEFMQGTPKQED